MIGHWTRRLRQTRRLAVAVLVVLLVACAESPAGTQPTTAGEPASPTSASPTTAQPSTSQPSSEERDPVTTTIRITVDDQVITAQLADNPTAQDLAAQLPLTLNIRDFNRLEKVAKLPRLLTMEGVPAGDDPEINDLGYYAPSGDLVFYYDDVGYFNGIVRIGRFSGQDMDVIERQPDGREITIERG
jgi:hypothetical protein